MMNDEDTINGIGSFLTPDLLDNDEIGSIPSKGSNSRKK